MSRYKSIQLITWIMGLLLASWILSKLPLSTISRSISSLSLMQWCSWIALNMVIISLYVQRWLYLTKPLGISVNFKQLLLVRQAGQAVSFITPGPQFGGEPLQIFWLWRNFSSPGHDAFLAVSLDRFYELWINFAVLLGAILVLIASPAIELADWKSIASLLIVLMLSLTTFGWLILRQQNQISQWLKRLAERWKQNTRLSNLDTHWNMFSSKLGEIVNNHKTVLFYAFILSILGWAGMIAELWLLLIFFDLPIDVVSFTFIFVSIRLAFLLPLPGGIGALEAALFWAFLSLHLPVTVAAAVIALMRLRDGIILTGGLIALRGLHINN